MIMRSTKLNPVMQNNISILHWTKMYTSKTITHGSNYAHNCDKLLSIYQQQDYNLYVQSQLTVYSETETTWNQSSLDLFIQLQVKIRL